MALRAFYFIRALTKALTSYYINRSQRHLLAAIENNWMEGPLRIVISVNFDAKFPKNRVFKELLKLIFEWISDQFLLQAKASKEALWLDQRLYLNNKFLRTVCSQKSGYITTLNYFRFIILTRSVLEWRNFRKRNIHL